MNYLANEQRYTKMAYHRTGKSGLQLPPISFGPNGLGMGSSQGACDFRFNRGK